MKRLSATILMLALVCLTASAQNRRFVVRSFTPSDLGDMRARTAPVMDNNKKLTRRRFAHQDLHGRLQAAGVHHPGKRGH